MRFFCFFACVILFNLSSFAAKSQQLDEIKSFLSDSFVPVYDCPDVAQIDIIDGYLNEPSLSIHQRFDLLSRKTHALICLGEFQLAQDILSTILNEQAADRRARYYISSIYQYGFIYDVRNDDRRCDYYSLAKDSSYKKFVDIRTSASLNHTIYCIGKDESIILPILYEILQEIVATKDKAAMAHARNTIALFYGERRFTFLAIDQLEKALALAEEIYTPENQLAIVVSLITNYMIINSLDRAEEAIEKFKKINSTIDSRRFDFLENYLTAGLYIRQNDFEKLEALLTHWKASGINYNESFTNGLLRFYEAVLCLENKDKPCLVSYLEFENTASPRFFEQMIESRDFLSFQVKLNLFMRDFETAQDRFDMYVEAQQVVFSTLERNYSSQQISSLQARIVNLEERLDEQTELRNNALVLSFFGLVLLTLVAFYLYRLRVKKGLLYDNTTGLLNNSVVISRLSKLPAPTGDNTNALAVFDIANFTEVNLLMGATKSDYVLKTIADTLKNITRDSDILGVFGPSRFIMCLADIDEKAAKAFFERVNHALANTFARHSGHGGEVNVDSSMSIYYGTEAFSDIDEILNNLLESINMKSNSKT